MATVTRIPVNPEVLIWARTTADLDLDAAASRIGVKPERLRSYEAGEQDPTINQIRGLAAAYHRPLAAMFLPEPLTDEVRDRLPDYRRAQVQTEVTPRALQNAIMRARRQQDALREVADELELPTEALTARFSLDLSEDAEQTGSVLRQALSVEALPKSAVARPDDLFRALVRAAESLNVTVIQVQRVNVKSMRGFSLGEGTCPVVAVNGADWPRGKVFTLLHELAHIGFHTSGLCDLEQDEDPDVEHKCNQVAAAALMPARPLLAALGSRNAPMTTELARMLGNEFGASGEAAVLRLIDLKHARWEDYRRLKPEFDQAYLDFKTYEKERSAGKDSPIFYQLKARDLGRRFIQQVLSAYGEGALSSRDLVQLLEVSYDKIPRLAATIREDF